MKAIKFNLQYGDKQIKSLTELKEYGNIDMLLETLNNGMLERWLEAHGYNDLKEQVKNIDKNNDRKACDTLCTIFFDAEEASTAQKAAAEIFKLRKNETITLQELKDLKFQRNKIIDDYHKGYNELLNSFKNNCFYYAGLKAGMTELYKQYGKLLKIDSENFYQTFKEFPLVMLAFMANEQLRNFINYGGAQLYTDIFPGLLSVKPILNAIKECEKGQEVDCIKKVLKEINIDNIGNDKLIDQVIVIDTKKDLEQFGLNYDDSLFVCFFYSGYDGSCDYIVTTAKQAQYYTDNSFYVPYDLVKLPHIKIFSGKTDKYWKDIEPKGKTFMIISMEKGNKVRSTGKTGEEKTSDDVNGKFIFTDGIDYVSDSDTDKLIYMEV